MRTSELCRFNPGGSLPPWKFSSIFPSKRAYQPNISRPSLIFSLLICGRRKTEERSVLWHMQHICQNFVLSVWTGQVCHRMATPDCRRHEEWSFSRRVSSQGETQLSRRVKKKNRFCFLLLKTKRWINSVDNVSWRERRRKKGRKNMNKPEQLILLYLCLWARRWFAMLQNVPRKKTTTTHCS